MSDGDVVSRAYAMLGSPYVWGGTTSAGFDCSGFVSYCLTGKEGTRLGTTNTFMGWNLTSNPQPGDICVNDGHTGIYVGDGRMIHASTYGVGVVESNVQDGMIFVTYN
jgi:cell wall-associated NlpC family hydrolase